MKKLKEQLQVEVDTSYLYGQLALLQDDVAIGNVLTSLSKIEGSHATHALQKIQQTEPSFTLPGPSRRARIQLKLGKIFGYDFIISGLMGVEKQIAQTVVREKLTKGEKPSGFEHTHLRIVEALSKNSSSNVSGGFLGKLEGRHKSVGGNALRAAVLGANDGLVSNMSLVMGVAGAGGQ